MRRRDLKALLARAAAALETPKDLTAMDVAALVEDLREAEDALAEELLSKGSKELDR